MSLEMIFFFFLSKLRSNKVLAFVTAYFPAAQDRAHLGTPWMPINIQTSSLTALPHPSLLLGSSHSLRVCARIGHCSPNSARSLSQPLSPCLPQPPLPSGDCPQASSAPPSRLTAHLGPAPSALPHFLPSGGGPSPLRSI